MIIWYTIDECIKRVSHVLIMQMIKDAIKKKQFVKVDDDWNKWPVSLQQILEPLCHNGFPLDLEDHKNMESPPIFSVRVWSVTRDTCF